MRRKFLSFLLAGVLCLSLLPAAALAAEPGLDNFGKVNTYAAGTFADVADTAWYAGSVQTAYELGLVNGTSETTFGPEGSITIGSALALACRLHSIYETGKALAPGGGGPWYQVYVDYAVEKGIITAGQFSDYNANATRRQFAAILAKALPAEALPEKNSIPDNSIPDVPITDANAADVYALYRAGILTGSDAAGTFAPETSIDRASVAAIVTRMADPSLRRELTPTVPLATVSLNKTRLALNAGDSETLTASVTPAEADQTVTWTSSNPSVATVENGKVTAKAEGTATITAAANGKSATCSVTVAAAPISFSGSGSKVISGVNIPFGSYYAELTHNGKSNFIVKLYYGSASYDYFLMANEIGVTGTRFCMNGNAHKAISNGMLEVDADGDWTIEIKPVSGTTTTNIKGRGTVITGVFTASAARNILTCTYNGESNFIVKVIKYNGTNSYDYELVTNEIGSYSGQKVVNLTAGTKYYISVIADGDWTIDFGLGEALTTYTPMAAPSGSSSGNGNNDRYDPDPDPDTGSGSSSNDGKYSYSEASDLHNYVKKATEAANDAANYCTTAMKNRNNPAVSLSYYNMAVSKMGSAARYMQSAIDILEAHNPIVRDDGVTLLELAQKAYDEMIAIAEMELTEDDLSTYHTTMAYACLSANSSSIVVMAGTSRLIEAFG